MSPIRLEVQDDTGDWRFAAYTDNENLVKLVQTSFQGVAVRVFIRGTLHYEKTKIGGVIDYRIN